ncbi:MAG: hypothetical protein K6U87_11845 [Firmicutes bacterium]|nr:hypothetical protein [Bacillota bacterium]
MDRLFENDTLLKILAVLVAIALWVQVSSTNVRDANRPFGPIALEWTPPPVKNLSVTALQPNSVEVQIKGPPQVVANATAHEIAAWVDLSHVRQPGTYSLPVVASVPSGTSLVSITPNQVMVTVDQIESRTFPVELQVTGVVPSQYEVTSITLSTKSAVVTGPLGALNQVQRVTAVIPVTGHTSSFEEQAFLQPLNQKGATVSHVEVNPPMITADVKIIPKPPEATVGVVVQLTGRPANGYHVTGITVSPGKITITGTKESLAGVTSVNTQPVNIQGATATVTKMVAIQFPPGVSAIGPSEVTATVTIARSS